MKRYLKEYPDKAAYDADEARKNLNASTVSLIGKDVIKDGVNVEVTVPSLGDAVYHDGNKKVRFIKYGTIVKESLPSDFVPIGVCGPYKGDDIYIINGNNELHKFAEFFRWKITGWKLDNQPHSSTIKFYDKTLPVDFSYTASTIEECCTQLDTFLRTNTSDTKKYIALLEEGEVIVQLIHYNLWSDYSLTMSGLTVTYWTVHEMEITPYAKVHHGEYICPVWNIERAKEYFSADLSSSSYNPTSPVTRVTTYPVCLPAYLGQSEHRDKDMCQWLRNEFGEGREGWENYIEQIHCVTPFPKGAASDLYGTGKEVTYWLAGQQSPDDKGVMTPLYPAAEFAAAMGYSGVNYLEKGSWFVPNLGEFCEIFNVLRYGLKGVSITESDPINETLNAMGLKSISSTVHSWLMSRFNTHGSWHAFNTGYTDSYGFYLRVRVVGLALYPIVRQDS